MQVNPLVSIIIPTYNREKFISDTLDSLLQQTYSNWEAIVVDDGSVDTTKQVVLNYCEQVKRIQFYERDREPKGGSVCRNIGLGKANGGYVIFLDSDDLLAPYCLQQRVENITSNPQIDFGVFHAKTFTHNINDGRLHTINMNASNPLYHFIAGHTIWQTACAIWKKSFVEKINGFDKNFQRFQDTEFGLRALLVDDVQFKVYANLKADCYYRTSHEKRNESFYDKVVENNFLFLEKVLHINQKKIDFEKYKKALYILNLIGVSYAVRSSGKYAKTYKKVLQQLKQSMLLGSSHYMFLMSMLNLTSYKFNRINTIKYISNTILLKMAFQKIKSL